MEQSAIESVLSEVVQRVLEIIHPKKIILFGSAVQGKMHLDSDLDFLIVVPSGVHRRKTAQKIYRNLIGVGFAADILVVTEDDVERFKGNISMVIKPALEAGRVLYAA